MWFILEQFYQAFLQPEHPFVKGLQLSFGTDPPTEQFFGYGLLTFLPFGRSPDVGFWPGLLEWWIFSIKFV
jgi:hypothetical protein